MGVAIANGILNTLGIAYKAPQIYRVQVGAYSNKANAEALEKKLKQAGFPAFIVKGEK